MTAAGAINLFYFYANKLIDISQKILYTWTVAGDGGTLRSPGGPTLELEGLRPYCLVLFFFA